MSQSNVPSSFDSTSTLTVAAPVLAEAVFTGVVTAPAAAAPPGGAPPPARPPPPPTPPASLPKPHNYVSFI
jgi:hypothetical protein